MVAGGEQVNAGLLGKQCDVWVILKRLNELNFDGFAGGIRDVDDTRKGVTTFAGEGERATFDIKLDAEAVYQDIFKQAWPVF